MKPQIRRSLFTGLSLLGICFAASVAEARYETCYEQQYICETRYEQQCNYEDRCETVPGDRQCHQVRLCTPRPSEPNCQMVTECGTNALGQQVCKERKVCNGSSSGGEDCGYVDQCETGPSHQQCHQEQVCEQVPRHDCHYESVAKQCYVPDPAPVPEPTPAPQPAPEPAPWPAPQPAPQPEPVDPDPVVTPPVPVDPSPVVPEPQPPVEPSVPGDNGSASLTDLQMTIAKSKVATVLFKDRGQSLTYRTRYFLSVYDRNGNVVINQFASADGKVLQAIQLQEELARNEYYALVLKVVRTGGELVQDVKFEKKIEVNRN